ncbi:MAG: aminopeptidase [Treponema sp.]|nr:aminopeptidase [Treponema sp.]
MDLFKKKTLNKKERNAAQVVVQDVVAVKKGERVLIIANPATNPVAQSFYLAADEVGAVPTLIFQNDKTSFDNANKEVIAALKTEPEVCFSISNVKLGKDEQAQANPYKTEDGQTFTHIFDYLLDGKKTMRGVWTPGITEDMLNRTANIDYAELQHRCVELKKLFQGAVSVHVTAPAGTDVEIDVQGRELLFDDGDFTKPGTGGNIPAGEVFISPVVGKTKGVIVYDGSMTFSDGDALLESPITCKLENGFVSEITGGASAKRLLKTITEAEAKPALMEKENKMQKDQAPVYKRNARNIGELGIGLNPAAQITGNMLEDEKAFHTCHFAIGENYDNDAPALIHLDGVVRDPTIVINYADKESVKILENGDLLIK